MARITGISIRNFKAVGEEPVTLALAPITLLYGPNGAGKSTILHALHYAREILENRNYDPDRTLSGGGLDLGGYRNFIHGRDLDRDLVLGFALEPFEMGIDLVPNFDGFGLAVDAGRLIWPDHVEEAEVELTLRWSHIESRPYVARCAIGLYNRFFAAFEASPDLRNVELVDLDLEHPVLQLGGHSDDDADRGIEAVLFAGKADREGRPIHRIGILNSDDALPRLDTPLHLDFEQHPMILDDERVAHVRHAARLQVSRSGSPAEYIAGRTEQLAVADYMSAMLIGPLQQLREALGGLVSIGPLRDLPPRGYRPQRSPHPGRWAGGLAAWDRLSTMDEQEAYDVDEWLDRKLESGFGVRIDHVREVSRSGEFAMRMGIATALDLDDLKSVWAEMPEEPRVVIRDTTNAIDVEPSDIGVGVSQVLPVIVAALDDNIPFVSIEQPELHIHPRLQTGLGDLFAFAVGGPSSPTMAWGEEITLGTNARTMLVETHSEHLVLRLLRRIRELSDGELEPGAPEVAPELLSVNYLLPGEDGVRLVPLPVDKTGDFTVPWPGGFFAERRAELF